MLSQALTATNNFFMTTINTDSKNKASISFFYIFLCNLTNWLTVMPQTLSSLAIILRCILQISKWRHWYPTFSMLPVSPHSLFAVSALFLYSSSASHRAPSSRSFAFLSETKKKKTKHKPNTQPHAFSTVALQPIQSVEFCTTRTFYRQTQPTLQPGHLLSPSVWADAAERDENSG